MPKKRKTRKQKLQASIKQTTVPTAVATPAENLQQPVRMPEKFSLQNVSFQHNVHMVSTHTYLNKELLKTAILSASIVIAEVILFILLRNHILVLSNIAY